ncbi:hypothetical protein T07_1942 [Trichinella nelsoni]|uniref:Uncharacterized protein n=1 Tax=Trichinella nelsoni TaxID=6336 RepID=A0A0V0RA85_9BILA|nr:hypothetical protein T07_1942 [Trichinella nelsoni]
MQRLISGRALQLITESDPLTLSRSDSDGLATLGIAEDD